MYAAGNVGAGEDGKGPGRAQLSIRSYISFGDRETTEIGRIYGYKANGDIDYGSLSLGDSAVRGGTGKGCRVQAADSHYRQLRLAG